MKSLATALLLLAAHSVTAATVAEQLDTFLHGIEENGGFSGVVLAALDGETVLEKGYGYALLAGIVERASGERFESYCRDKIFAPAAMDSTGFCGESFPGVRLALGYGGPNDRQGRVPNQDPYPPQTEFGYAYVGMGGVCSTVPDLGRFVKAMQNGEILGEPATKKLVEPCRPGVKRSCAWEVFDFPDGRKCVGHGGSVAGYVCKLWVFPDDNGLLLVLSNDNSFDYQWLTEMYRRLFDISPKRLAARRAAGAGPQQPRRAAVQGFRRAAAVPQPKPGLEVVKSLDQLVETMTGKYQLVGPFPLLELEIERSGNGLKARFIPPEAPFETEFKKECQVADKIFTELANNQVHELRRKMRRPSNIPESWPDHVLDYWQQQCAEQGGLKKLSHWVIGADSFTYMKWMGIDDDGGLLWDEEKVVRVWVRCNFGSGPIVAMVGFVGGEVQYFYDDASESFCRTTSDDVFLLRQDGDWIGRDDPYGETRITRNRGRVILSQQIGRDGFLRLEFEAKRGQGKQLAQLQTARAKNEPAAGVGIQRVVVTPLV